jgi:hypothetical protein
MNLTSKENVSYEAEISCYNFVRQWPGIIYIETRGDTSSPTGLSDVLVQMKRYEAYVIASREWRILY